MSRVAQVLQAVARHEVERRPTCELAVVTSNFDGLDGDDTHTVSVRLKDSGIPITRVPVATGATGVGVLPRVGDVVLVMMPRGDLASALVAGQVYSDERRPPDFSRDEVALVWPGDAVDPEQEAVDIRVFADGSDRRMSVGLGGDLDAQVEVSDGEIALRAGGTLVRLRHSSATDGTVSLESGGTKVTLAQDGDLSLEAVGAIKLKGAQVEIQGDTNVSINGQIVELN